MSDNLDYRIGCIADKLSSMVSKVRKIAGDTKQTSEQKVSNVLQTVHGDVADSCLEDLAVELAQDVRSDSR